MSVINTNIKSLVAQDSLVKSERSLSTAMERLSTGKRINSAKDDAAGLAIGARMEAQSRGLTMAIKNANDGVSLMQTAEGAMDEVSSILQRMRELAVQSVNGTNNDSDRVALNDEVNQLKAEIDRIATTTEFNNQKILDGSFKDKKLQIGDKGYQTMDVDIASIKLKDLGMGAQAAGSDTMIGQRVSLGAVDAGDILINDQELGAITATDDLADVINNINENVDNVTASGFNTVVSKQVGTGITTDGQFRLKVQALDAASATEYAISASSSLEELVANINAEAGAQVQASINDDGKLVLSNNTGATIQVVDQTGTADGYETGSGFKSTSAAGFVAFAGFLKLESDDGNPVRIEVGNRDSSAPGAVADLEKLGFREVTSEFNKAQDAYTVSGKALTTAGVTGTWTQTDLKINGVQIYDEDIATDSFQGKLDAINNLSEQTGVIAYAQLDQTISFSASSFALSVNSTIALNGTTVLDTASTSGSVTVASVAAAINTYTSATGITATLDGNNIRLTGSNVQSLRIDTAQSGASGTIMTIADNQILYAAIRLDSASNNPISIELGEGAAVAEHGFLEQNVGAADFQVNAATLGVASGTSMTGLNVGSASAATKAISTIDNAIEKISSSRSKLGAMENRLVSTINNLSNVVTNTDASKSRIMDTDYSKETTALAKSQIIQQAATAMLAQANQSAQSVLSLLK